jgi:hypothetical protein
LVDYGLSSRRHPSYFQQYNCHHLTNNCAVKNR